MQKKKQLSSNKIHHKCIAFFTWCLLFLFTIVTFSYRCKQSNVVTGLNQFCVATNIFESKESCSLHFRRRSTGVFSCISSFLLSHPEIIFMTFKYYNILLLICSSYLCLLNGTALLLEALFLMQNEPVYYQFRFSLYIRMGI